MNKLRQARVMKGISQLQLRLDTGIHQSRISMIEHGWVVPRPDEVERLCRALGVRSEDIEEVNTSAFDGHIS